MPQWLLNCFNVSVNIFQFDGNVIFNCKFYVFPNEAFNKTVNRFNKLEIIMFLPLIGFIRLTRF